MSKVNALYHIVFATKNRKMTITNDYREDLYRFVWSIVKDNKSKLIRISGIANHIHLLVDLSPAIALSDLMRDIKSKSSGWLKLDGRFPNFEGWAKEYFAATLSYSEREGVIEYIKSQQDHHGIEDLDNELKRLVEKEGIVLLYNDLR